MLKSRNNEIDQCHQKKKRRRKKKKEGEGEKDWRKTEWVKKMWKGLKEQGRNWVTLEVDEDEEEGSRAVVSGGGEGSDARRDRKARRAARGCLFRRLE